MGPLTKLEYLGIILDSVNMQAELPQDKVQRLIKMLHKYSKKTSCTKLAILSLLEHMSFFLLKLLCLGVVSCHIC